MDSLRVWLVSDEGEAREVQVISAEKFERAPGDFSQRGSGWQVEVVAPFEEAARVIVGRERNRQVVNASLGGKAPEGVFVRVVGDSVIVQFPLLSLKAL